jgi:mono/diheme cytochrome c family protein
MKKLNYLFVLVAVFAISCGGGTDQASDETTTPPASMVADEPSADPMENKGIGPVTSVTLADEIDTDMAAKGEELYATMCTACHKPDAKYIGPAPKGILTRRSPEWIMNMILNPDEMVQKDPVARALLAEFNGAPMANQNLTEEQARQVLEYFRTLD